MAGMRAKLGMFNQEIEDESLIGVHSVDRKAFEVFYLLFMCVLYSRRL